MAVLRVQLAILEVLGTGLRPFNGLWTMNWRVY